MATLNVNPNVTDIFYRYKMPRLRIKSEGRGNGVKTVIENMADIARALERPPAYPTKYFGCELGAQTIFDYKNERFIVNGAHDANKLQNLLFGFISKYVLCPDCESPETDLTVNVKNSTIAQKCKACGFYGTLKNNHKLNTYILKNPPTIKTTKHSGAHLTEGRRSKRSVRKSTDNDNSLEAGTSAHKNCSLNVSNISMLLDSKDKDKDKDKDSNKLCGLVENQHKDNNNVVNDDDNDDSNIEWSVDVSREAIRARLQNLTDTTKFMTLSNDCDKSFKERIDLFYELVKTKLEKNELQMMEVQKELFIEAERLDITQRAPLVLSELVFTENVTQDVRKYHKLFLRFTHNSKKAQKYLIAGLEQTIYLHREKLLGKIAGIFKYFYDNDLLDESVILDWAQKNSTKYVPKDFAAELHNKVQPFVKWLQEAEEEDSTETENESAGSSNDANGINKSAINKMPENFDQVATAEEKDDIDNINIDSI